MDYIGKIVSNVKDIYQTINPATLSGAIDIIAVEQVDKTIVCSPFYVKFGKIDVLRAYNKDVDIFVNDKLVDIRMHLSDSGEAYFDHLEGPCNCASCTKIANKDAKNNSLDEDFKNCSLSDTENRIETGYSKENFFRDDSQFNQHTIPSSRENYDDKFCVTPSNMEDKNAKNSFNESPAAPYSEFEESPIKHHDSSSRSLSKLSKLEDSNISAYLDIKLSTCGNLKSSTKKPETFDANIVNFDHFVKTPSLLNNYNLVVQLNNMYYKWAVAAPIIMSYLCFNSYLPKETLSALKKQHMPKAKKSWFIWRNSDEKESTDEDYFDPIKNIIKERQKTEIMHEMAYSDPGTPPSVINKKTHMQPNKQSNSSLSLPNLFEGNCLHKVRLLTSEELRLWNLKPGDNSITFSVTTRYQGTVECSAKIFLWQHSDKIIISDVDGTITRSDVLGMLFPVVGKDWTQDGVTKLFSLINVNGYRIIYLSARTIGISNRTRIYLQSILCDTLCLPSGPIILSPSSLFESLHREVIQKKPELFKISCLQTIRDLFPTDKNPFMAGFGNRSNDYVAYNAVGIPHSKIFIINYKGQIKHQSSSSYSTSYRNMAEFVDLMFPMLGSQDAENIHLDQYNDFFFWRKSRF